MATNNPIDSLDPIQVALGGTGDSTLATNGVLYGNGTSPVGVTSAGIAGQILLSNGAGNPPSWGSPGGNLVRISTGSPTNGSLTYNITSGISATYNTYLLVTSRVNNTPQNDQLIMKVSTNGGSSYISSGYLSGALGGGVGNSFVNSNSTSSFLISDTAQQNVVNAIWLFNVTGGGNMMATGYYSGGNASFTESLGYVSGYINTSAVNALQFSWLNGNTFYSSASPLVLAGYFSLYGLIE